MLLFSWLAVPVLVVGAVLLAAFWLRQPCRVPMVIMVIAAGFGLLYSLLTRVIIGLVTVIMGVDAYVASIRSVVVFFVLLAPAISAIFAETLRYLSFRAGRSMRANRTIGGALMVGLGYGGMSAIIGWLFYLPYLMRHGALPRSWLYTGLFVFGSVVGCALVVITELGLATLVVLAYRRSLLFLPLAVLAHFVVNASTPALVMVHSGLLWALALIAFWAAAAVALVVLVHRSGWLTAAPQDEPATIVA